MNSKLLFFLLLLTCCKLSAQEQDLSQFIQSDSIEKDTEPVYATFKSTRIVNGRSNETVKKSELDLVISHRFGDAGGHYGGIKTFFGTDNASDVKVALDYGLTNKWSVGVSRTKGATAIRELYEANSKFKLLEQTQKNRIPFSITLFGNAVMSAMTSNVNPTVPDHFDRFADRWSFVGQMILTKKINSNYSVAVSPTYVHYNRVGHGDTNDHFALGFGARAKLTKRLALIADYFYHFKTGNRDAFFSSNGLNFYNPLAAGIEIETGGHVFQITFMNSTALLENQFVPYTTTTWEKGQFRWGFSISRPFALGKKKAK
ncbi:MAG: DUF5777 family beta-barrel protein [Bacteroidota bacterium]